MNLLNEVLNVEIFAGLFLLLCDVIFLILYFLEKHKFRNILSKYGSVVLSNGRDLSLRKDPVAVLIIGKYLLFREYEKEKETRLIETAKKARLYLKIYLILFSILALIIVSIIIVPGSTGN